MTKLHETHPTFQGAIFEISKLAGKTSDEVYDLWKEYAAYCQAADQSAILFEFVELKRNELGGNFEQLRTIVRNLRWVC